MGQIEDAISKLPDLQTVAAEIHQWRTIYPSLDAHLTAQVDEGKAVRALALSVWSNGDAAGAVTMLQAALVLSPGDPWVFSDLSGALAATGRLEEARVFLSLSLNLDPSHAQRWVLFAGYCLQCGETEDAKIALNKALEINPGLDQAWISLGITCLQTKDFDASVQCLREGMRLAEQGSLVHACFGEALFHTGDIPGSAQAYRDALARGVNDATVLSKHLFAQLLEALLTQPPALALKIYDHVSGLPVEPPNALINKAFHILSSYGHRPAALSCAHYLLEQSPDDPILIYLTDVLRGEVTQRAPDDYIVEFFDQFSETFEDKLVGLLQYRVPETIAAEIVKRDITFRSCLDLGCGTGLMAQLIHQPGRTITGVDLSPGMLAKAAQRDVYASLIQSEIHEYLAGATQTFDAIIAADVLVYIGDLQGFFAGAANCLAEGGHLIVSVETTHKPDFEVLPSGRFAHQLDYLQRLSAGTFALERIIPTNIRRDTIGFAAGAIVFMRRMNQSAQGAVLN